MDYLMEADMYRNNCEINILSEMADRYINEDTNKFKQVANAIISKVKKIIEKIREFVNNVAKPKIKKLKTKLAEMKAKNNTKKFENNEKIKVGSEFYIYESNIDQISCITELLANAGYINGTVSIFIRKTFITKNKDDLQNIFIKYKNDISKYFKLKYLSEDDVKASTYPVDKYVKKVHVKYFNKADYTKNINDLEYMDKLYDEIYKDYCAFDEKMNEMYNKLTGWITKGDKINIVSGDMLDSIITHINTGYKYIRIADSMAYNRILHDISNLRSMDKILNTTKNYDKYDHKNDINDHDED